VRFKVKRVPAGVLTMVLGATTLGILSGTAVSAASAAQPAPCTQSRWVASWTASPTDSVVPVDPTLRFIPRRLTDQTIRMVITPHLAGSSIRIHLSNRFGTTALKLGHVTVAAQTMKASTGKPAQVTFAGATAVTVAAGQDIVSDPVAMTIKALTPLSVSIYVPTSTSPPTKHWNANATSYYADSATGDLTRATSGAKFSNLTYSWLYIDGLDVRAKARAVVAFGDSITDGFVAGSPVSIPVTKTVADKNGRYPDDLQRRIDAAGLPISVVNAGIGSNALRGTLGLMDGPSGLSRFPADALEVPGVSGILVLEGINDLGLHPFSTTVAQMEAGYAQLIKKAHAQGKLIWLGTITPAANALIDGVLLTPRSEIHREQINAWIRSQKLADGVVDFDAAVRDPAHPSRLLPAYAGPDNLHPNLAGYQKMASAVPLSLLAATSCSGKNS
jgi:lysophospholipase L1-like esterase